jgi:uncharacterized membrane protein
MDIRPYGFGPGQFRGGDGVPFRGALVQHVDGGSGPSSLAWAIFALVLVLLVLAIVSLAIDAYYRSRGTPSATKSVPDAGIGHRDSGQALAVLDRRYARGKVSREEYLQTRDDLRGAADATTRVIPPQAEPA